MVEKNGWWQLNDVEEITKICEKVLEICAPEVINYRKGSEKKKEKIMKKFRRNLEIQSNDLIDIHLAISILKKMIG